MEKGRGRPAVAAAADCAREAYPRLLRWRAYDARANEDATGDSETLPALYPRIMRDFAPGARLNARKWHLQSGPAGS